MKLNRNNYEEYFILYMDNELDSESRREVEAFVKQNPDLGADLDLLKQSKLSPDEEISFNDKGSLMRFDSASISLSNYEEWLTSYIDDELTDGERRDVDVFVAGNPAIQRELNLLQQAKLQPEAIVFPGKESLYRKEERARVISIRWWKVAAAAMLLLGISSTAVILINNRHGKDAGDVTKSTPKVTLPANSRSNDPVTQPVVEPANKEQLVSSESNKKDVNKPAELRNTSRILVKQTDKPEEKKETSVKEEKPLIAYNKDERANSQLIQPELENRKRIDLANNNSETSGKYIQSGNNQLTISQPENRVADVTPETPQPSYAVESESGGNKGIRGFLRKVTRTIEKRTNIKATDEDDRLLVAGLAIKL